VTIPAVAGWQSGEIAGANAYGGGALLTLIPVPEEKDTEMTTPETTANPSLRSREHANIPPERRDHRTVTVSTTGPGVDTHDMVLIHRVIRREIGQLPRLFRSAANDPARSKIIGAHAREMLDFLHHHHTGEDMLLFPLLRERRVLDPELVDRMDAQHAQVNDAVVAINAELPVWTASADAAAGERMAARIDTTMPTLIGHLDEEEQKLLPVASVTVTQSEWDALGKDGMSAIPVTRRLVLLGYITEDTDDAERQKLMQEVPAPVRLAFKLIGHRQFTRETAAIRA
jgi:hemerythrin-like domain-containing protein